MPFILRNFANRVDAVRTFDLSFQAHPLSALCWAHGNGKNLREYSSHAELCILEILFAACGSYVYTIWIKHQPLPSMLTLCQMKIKENLLNNSLQNLDKLCLPNNLRQNLHSFYRSTIKGFLPDPKSLRSFVCNPLKSHLRLQCTMKRIDHEPEYISNMPTNTHLSGATYVLYLEYLGGLIPLLTAKRVSKICPDFIIFDPQMKSSNHLSTLSSRKMHSRKRHFSSLRSRSNTFDQTPTVQQQTTKFSTNANNRSSLITNRNSIYVADNGLNNNGDDLRTNKSSSGCSSENDSEMEDDEQQQQDHQRQQIDDGKRTRSMEKRSRKTPGSSSKVVKHKHVRD